MNIRVTCAFLIVTSLMTTSPALAQNPFDILNKIIKEVDRQNRQKPEPKREPKPKQNIPQSDAQSRQGQPISNLSYNLSNGMETLNNIEREFASRCKKINTITSALPKNEFGRHGCLPTEYKKTVEWAGLWDKIEIHINWLKGIKNQQYKGRCREQYRNTRFEPNNHLIKVCVGYKYPRSTPIPMALKLGIKIDKRGYLGGPFNWQMFDRNHTRITQYVLNEIDQSLPEIQSFVQKRLVVVNKAAEENLARKKSEEKKMAAKNAAAKKSGMEKAALEKAELAQDENDAMQQIMNYLVTADPLKRDNGYYKATIFDRKNCVAGWKDRGGGHLKIYWNNLDKKAIKIGKFYRDSAWMNYLVVTGNPKAADANFKNYMVTIAMNAKGLGNGSHSTAQIPLGKPSIFDSDRTLKALGILYSKYCRGSKKKTAF